LKSANEDINMQQTSRMRGLPPKTMTRSSKCETWKDSGRATPDEIIGLQRLGFKVEDLGAEYGPAHQGAFRWVNIVAGEFQQDGESQSEAEAWAAAQGAAVANERTIPWTSTM
jgi:hypothetical protein